MNTTTRRFPRTLHQAFPNTPEAAQWLTVYRRSWIDRHPALLLAGAAALVAAIATIAAVWPLWRRTR